MCIRDRYLDDGVVYGMKHYELSWRNGFKIGFRVDRAIEPDYTFIFYPSYLRFSIISARADPDDSGNFRVDGCCNNCKTPSVTFSNDCDPLRVDRSILP